MCGIVGATTNQNVVDLLLEGLERLSYRGYDSAGIAVQTGDGAISRVRKSGTVSELCNAVETTEIRGTTGIAHTRWATHGIPSVRNAQPHLSNREICIVHNGIIENFETLRAELQDLGYGFTSETDSESIVHLMHHCYQDSKDLLDAVLQTTKKLEGAYAFCVISRDRPHEIVVARQGCPVVIGLGEDGNYVASDVLTLRVLTDQFIILNEGDIAVISPERVCVYDQDGKEIPKVPEKITDVVDEMDKGDYEFYMEKEIYDQPQVVRDTLEGRVTANSILARSLGRNAPEVLSSIEEITIVGCGTAYYAGAIAKYWIEELANIPCSADIASEFRYRHSGAKPKSLFLTLSQSGETADTLEALRVSKERGFAHTMTICNVATSTLVRESDIAVLMHAGIEVSVASTKAFVAMLIDLLLLAVLLARFRRNDVDLESEVVQALHQLDSTIAEVLKLSSRMKELAREFVDRDHALFLGRGTQYPIALEGALKLKEISYLHAEGYPAGELKHGPLALVDDNMPVIAVAPSNQLLEKVISNLEEVRARGARLYVFADREFGMADREGVTVIELPKVHPLLVPIIYVIPLQLLAYHVAVARNNDPDKPRNLAKSVTVE
ncbi:MAG: glutamine--fructose-6-phosphate transaminase (isomerizing) [Gammaproteobacteria bacterium]|nr:glutamine--fructose-6-phosphate transaminase (isomerizing) [Gammaproteobacteria bacterium]